LIWQRYWVVLKLFHLLIKPAEHLCEIVPERRQLGFRSSLEFRLALVLWQSSNARALKK